MIKEKFVSAKLARLLKEKGFNESVREHYYSINNQLSNINTEYNTWNDYPDFISAPTYQMVFDWLREKYNIEIFISVGYPHIKKNGNYVFNGKTYFWDVAITTDDHLIYPFDNNNVGTNSYEETSEIAIETVLNKLI